MPEWNQTIKRQFICFSVGLLLFTGLLLKSEPGFVPILDSANLVFHEAGHPLFGLLIRGGWGPVTVTPSGSVGSKRTATKGDIGDHASRGR